MRFERALVVVRPGDGYGQRFMDLDEFMGQLEGEIAPRPTYTRRDEDKAWHDAFGPLLADVVEYVEIDAPADLHELTELVRSQISPHAQEFGRLVPVFLHDKPFDIVRVP